jgi:hypothetical protein
MDFAGLLIAIYDYAIRFKSTLALITRAESGEGPLGGVFHNLRFLSH